MQVKNFSGGTRPIIKNYCYVYTDNITMAKIFKITFFPSRLIVTSNAMTGPVEGKWVAININVK